MGKVKRNYLAAVIFIFCISGGNMVFAAPDSDTAGSKEDSVYSWGHWGKIVSPSAGPEIIYKDDTSGSEQPEKTASEQDDSKDAGMKNE